VLASVVCKLEATVGLALVIGLIAEIIAVVAVVVAVIKLPKALVNALSAAVNVVAAACVVKEFLSVSAVTRALALFQAVFNLFKVAVACVVLMVLSAGMDAIAA